MEKIKGPVPNLVKKKINILHLSNDYYSLICIVGEKVKSLHIANSKKNFTKTKKTTPKINFFKTLTVIA